MENWWVRFGCFLTGYNYNILRVSSEVSAKTLKRYTAALLIVCILWAFIGYEFTFRYLKGGVFGSLVGSLVLCVIIIQIERQIILSPNKNTTLYVFRTIIAVAMALIGSVIIDQIIFKEDIAQGKILAMDAKVNKILPGREAELKHQIDQLDTAILKKEIDRKVLTDDISAHPMIKSFTSQRNTVPVTTSSTDSSKKTTTKINLIHTNTLSTSTLANPNIALLNPLDIQIANLRAAKAKKDSSLLTLRPIVENEIKANTGFLDELKIMFSIIMDSTVALFVWLLWLVFLMGIELFIMVSKMGEVENDYDLTLLHHMELQKRKLALLSKAVPNDK